MTEFTIILLLQQIRQNSFLDFIDDDSVKYKTEVIENNKSQSISKSIQSAQSIQNSEKSSSNNESYLLRPLNRLNINFNSIMSSSSGRQSEDCESTINTLLEKVNRLEKEIKEKDKIINDLNKKVEELQKSNKSQVSQVNNNSQNDKIQELEEEVQKLRAYFLSPGEKLMTLKIISSDQTMSFSTYCKPNDKISKIEEIINNIYPNYSEEGDNNYFLANGLKINRQKSLADNNIKNNDILTCINNNDDDDN